MNAKVIPITSNLRTPPAACDLMPGTRRRIAAGKEICVQDDDAVEIYQLVSGAVRTTHLTADGRRQIGAFNFPGDIFGLECGAVHRYSAEALTDCEVIVARRSALCGAENEVTALDRAVWTGTARQLERTQEHLMLLGRKTACEKVAAFLSDVAARFGRDVTDLPMGRQDMADYLGLTIETVSRMITQLQSEGLIEFFGCRRYRLRDAASLRRLAAA
jgi:CRP/FNR family nitrogen fixation transcriptional regulator